MGEILKSKQIQHKEVLSEGAGSVLERVDEVLFEKMTFDVQPGQERLA